MPLFEITSDQFRPIHETSFESMKIKERNGLQRLLRTQIEVLSDDLYVLSEEFGDWEDSKRRIDLMAIDREANLVVIHRKPARPHPLPDPRPGPPLAPDPCGAAGAA